MSAIATQTAYTREELLLQREWRKIAPDWDSATLAEKVEAFTYFCEKYASIRHPSKGKIPFVLRDAQRETVEAWLSNRYSIVLKARQIGFSTLVSIFCFWLAFCYSDRHIIMLSRTEREASKLLDHAKYVYSFMPDWLRMLGPELSWTQTKCVMNNASALESMPSANDPARGSTAFVIVVDEIAFLNNSDEAWASIEPVTDVGGSVIMLSTANGEGNLFHKIWIGSQNGTNKFKGVFFPWSAGDRDEKWYQSKVDELPEWQVAQEYPSDPEEAFLKSGRPVFATDKLRALRTTEPERGRLQPTADGIEFVEDGGSLAVWERPKPEGTYVIGADVAMGLAHGDYSSAHVIDARTSKVVAHWWGHGDADRFGDYVLDSLGRWYNNALLAPENNNHGLTTITALANERYPNLYRQRSLTKRRKNPTETLGWNTNKSSKPLAIDELAAMIRDETLGLCCEHTISELRTFVREGDGKMHGSPHDDRVMSLAIAVQMLKFVWLPEYESGQRKAGPGTWGHFFARMFKDDDGEALSPIGSYSVSDRAA